MVSSQLVVAISTPSSWVRTGSIELTMLPSNGPTKAPTAMPANALICAIRPNPGAVSVEVVGPERRASWVTDTIGSSSTVNGMVVQDTPAGPRVARRQISGPAPDRSGHARQQLHRALQPSSCLARRALGQALVDVG